jgi:hypothetical protein
LFVVKVLSLADRILGACQKKFSATQTTRHSRESGNLGLLDANEVQSSVKFEMTPSPGSCEKMTGACRCKKFPL